MEGPTVLIHGPQGQRSRSSAKMGRGLRRRRIQRLVGAEYLRTKMRLGDPIHVWRCHGQVPPDGHPLAAGRHGAADLAEHDNTACEPAEARVAGGLLPAAERPFNLLGIPFNPEIPPPRTSP